MQGNYLKGYRGVGAWWAGWARRLGRLGIFHAVFGGLKLDASGLVSGMLGWSLDILIGKSVLLDQSKILMTSIPCQPETRPDASDFQLSIAYFLVTVCPTHPKFDCFLHPDRIIVRILVCTYLDAASKFQKFSSYKMDQDESPEILEHDNQLDQF